MVATKRTRILATSKRDTCVIGHPRHGGLPPLCLPPPSRGSRGKKSHGHATESVGLPRLLRLRSDVRRGTCGCYQLGTDALWAHGTICQLVHTPVAPVAWANRQPHTRPLVRQSSQCPSRRRALAFEVPVGFSEEGRGSRGLRAIGIVCRPPTRGVASFHPYLWRSCSEPPLCVVSRTDHRSPGR
jgi:hypothetical protein